MIAHKTIIYNGTAILSDRLLENAIVEIHNDEIQSIDTLKPDLLDDFHLIDAQGGFITPGFIDIHVHGGAGADFMDGTVEAVATAAQAHLRHGTTTLFPTTTTGTPQEIMAMIDACRVASQKSHESNLPRIPGIHLYGPYFAPEKVGCHSPSGCRSPLFDEYSTYFNTGFVRIATCAAELPGAQDFYKRADHFGCLITCGHSNANWAELQQAFQAGMRHVDHFWCAMSSVSSLRSRFGTPMQAGMEQLVLMNKNMSTEVIADGEHLSPELLEFAFQMIGPDRLCLVTDSNRALDMPPGPYVFGNQATGTSFESNGRVGLGIDGSLASSIQGMDHMVRHMLANTSATLPEVFRMASLTPARLLRIDADSGQLAPRYRADILILDQKLQIRKVIAAGKTVYENEY